MEKFEELAQQLDRGESIQLSSKFTRTGTFIGLVLGLIATPVAFYFLWLEWDEKPGHFIYHACLTTAILIFLCYHALHVADARLEGRTLYLNKILGDDYKVDASDVLKMRSLKSKGTQYTYVHFTDRLGNKQRVLILRKSPMFSIQKYGTDLTRKLITYAGTL
ncbi:MAG: hypothetical protein R2792_01495 [Saprospiraceae bacterium]